MGIRIVVDRDLCQGHGVCESEAPEVFEVGGDHKVVVLDDAPDEELVAGVELAVKYCPTHALRALRD
ncbi:MAG: ferredoxin [Microthrixaceae bacterium]